MVYCCNSAGERLREAQSAGFSSVGTCFHALGGTRSVIEAILLLTNICNVWTTFQPCEDYCAVTPCMDMVNGDIQGLPDGGV